MLVNQPVIQVHRREQQEQVMMGMLIPVHQD
jgi:hypothetical protein